MNVGAFGFMSDTGGGLDLDSRSWTFRFSVTSVVEDIEVVVSLVRKWDK